MDDTHPAHVPSTPPERPMPERQMAERVGVRYRAFWARLVVRGRRPIIIGVTGSVGKTSTTEIVGRMLAHPPIHALLGTVRRTGGNHNDRVGMPSVILGYPRAVTTWRGRIKRAALMPVYALSYVVARRAYPRYLVLEYGTDRIGDIARLVTMAQPTIAVVTAIGPSHLERMKSVSDIVEEKSQLIRHVPPSGLVLLGADNPYTTAMHTYTSAPVVRVPGRGRALAENVARAIGSHLGVPSPLVEEFLATCGPIAGRLQRIELPQLTVINDAFNANPLSVELWLETLAEGAQAGQRRVAILGDMNELGPEAAQYHRGIIPTARRCADVIVGVGPLAKDFEPDHWFPDVSACAAAIGDVLHPGDLVLIKGSHSVHLDRLMPTLRARYGAAAARA